MPGFDGTGPAGRGPMTGRGRGFCVVRLAGEGEANDALARVAKRTTGSDESVAAPGGKEATQMPWGDGTGPAGMGPMTGRAAGYCAGYPVPGYMNPAVGWRGYAMAPYAGMPYGGVMPPAYGRTPYGVAPRGFVGFGRGRGFGFGRGLAWRRGRGRAFGRGRGFAPALW